MRVICISVLFLAFTNSGMCQSVTYSLGLKYPQFSDWHYKPANRINPEFIVTGKLYKDYNLTGKIDFYLSYANLKDRRIGVPLRRVINSYDLGLNLVKKNFILSVGPSVRFRYEHKIVSIYFGEYNTDRINMHFDAGLFVWAAQQIPVTKKTVITFSTGYKHYIRGVNPFSFGVSLGRRF
jgi:hypothetical protein